MYRRYNYQQPKTILVFNKIHCALQFKHLPLYLEWAPAEVFRSASAVPDYRPAAAVAATDGGGDQEEDKDSTEVRKSNNTFL